MRKKKFQGFSSKDGWVIATGFLRFGERAAVAAAVVAGGILIT